MDLESSAHSRTRTKSVPNRETARYHLFLLVSKTIQISRGAPFATEKDSAPCLGHYARKLAGFLLMGGAAFLGRGVLWNVVVDNDSFRSAGRRH